MEWLLWTKQFKKELVIFNSESKGINSSALSKPTLALNSCIRNRKLSANKIMFSRDQNAGSNFHLDDKEIGDKKTELKKANHNYREKSKYSNCSEPAVPRNLEVGDYLYLKEDRSKQVQI